MEFLQSSFEYAHVPILYLDAIALVWFLGSWLGYVWFADAHYGKRINLIRIMDDMRSRWMLQMLRRDNRMMDATLIGNLLRAISFFASTSILILIGLVSILGAQTKALQVTDTFPFTFGASPLMFEAKVALLIVIFVYAFFKLTWSVRQYNYACIVVGAAPNPVELKPEHYEFAARAGKLIGGAGRHFNMGLRAFYFGLAVMGWFMNGITFMLATTLVVFVLHRREFRSHTVNNLIAIDEV
ncbi:MAG: DUF599 domain-containing protein [Rickettsiales bacterium]